MALVIRVLLVDNDPLVLGAISTILSSDPDITIVGRAQDGDQAEIGRASCRERVF